MQTAAVKGSLVAPPLPANIAGGTSEIAPAVVSSQLLQAQLLPAQVTLTEDVEVLAVGEIEAYIMLGEVLVKILV